MTKKVRYMYEAVLTVCLSMPIGCVQESGTEYPGSETDGAATAVVTLQVGAAGNVQTRAYGGDGAAIAGEFMNTLELFIVDGQGVVEKVIRATGDANFVPEDNGRGGCETDYSTTVTLRGPRPSMPLPIWTAMRMLRGKIWRRC